MLWLLASLGLFLIVYYLARPFLRGLGFTRAPDDDSAKGFQLSIIGSLIATIVAWLLVRVLLR